MTDLMRQNIEALSDMESYGGTGTCGVKYYDYDGITVRCGYSYEEILFWVGGDLSNAINWCCDSCSGTGYCA